MSKSIFFYGLTKPGDVERHVKAMSILRSMLDEKDKLVYFNGDASKKPGKESSSWFAHSHEWECVDDFLVGKDKWAEISIYAIIQKTLDDGKKETHPLHIFYRKWQDKHPDVTDSESETESEED
jgi:hypothetical protein